MVLFKRSSKGKCAVLKNPSKNSPPAYAYIALRFAWVYLVVWAHWDGSSCALLPVDTDYRFRLLPLVSSVYITSWWCIDQSCLCVSSQYVPDELICKSGHLVMTSAFRAVRRDLTIYGWLAWSARRPFTRLRWAGRASDEHRTRSKLTREESLSNRQTTRGAAAYCALSRYWPLTVVGFEELSGYEIRQINVYSAL